MPGFSPDFRSCRKPSCEMTALAAGILESLGMLYKHLMNLVQYVLAFQHIMSYG